MVWFCLGMKNARVDPWHGKEYGSFTAPSYEDTYKKRIDPADSRTY